MPSWVFIDQNNLSRVWCDLKKSWRQCLCMHSVSKPATTDTTHAELSSKALARLLRGLPRPLHESPNLIVILLPRRRLHPRADIHTPGPRPRHAIPHVGGGESARDNDGQSAILYRFGQRPIERPAGTSALLAALDGGIQQYRDGIGGERVEKFFHALGVGIAFLVRLHVHHPNRGSAAPNRGRRLHPLLSVKLHEVQSAPFDRRAYEFLRLILEHPDHRRSAPHCRRFERARFDRESAEGGGSFALHRRGGVPHVGPAAPLSEGSHGLHHLLRPLGRYSPLGLFGEDDADQIGAGAAGLEGVVRVGDAAHLDQFRTSRIGGARCAGVGLRFVIDGI
mmetsp:Transcript_38565/g.115752  ORF Transcript_38565/g.115752 Transcript_38565/m.115752 type:complete len:337 (+) Transcript_38565:34-1044(+)